VNPRSLDHVALWVADRDRIAGFLSRYVGMRVIERTDRFTLMGADARRGKLTLFAAEGPRERGALKHIALRVNDLDRARIALPSGMGSGDVLELEQGLELRLVEAPTPLDYDLDHVALYSADPAAAARAYETLGFEVASPGPAGVPRVEVAGAWIEFHPGDPAPVERPLLNHVGLLVHSAEQHRADADRLGVEVADWVDAPNTLAVFVWGPERVKIEYVEHKPTFSLV
jgi:catechol 2,3-dioxygenase-like lactoylglutathione lyase family enzyme